MNSKIDPSRLPIEQIGRVDRREPEYKPEKSQIQQGGFDRVLREEATGLKFSAHAEERIQRRDINFSTEELGKLRGAVERAENKGCKDTLILLGEKAFVVSIKNKTVITAISGSAIKEGVFTKIDSAVVS